MAEKWIEKKLLHLKLISLQFWVSFSLGWFFLPKSLKRGRKGQKLYTY